MTATTALSVTGDMVLVDMNGYKHPMTAGFVVKVLFLGWGSFLLAIITNCIYYIVHPMALKISPKDKLETFICGQIWDLEKCKCKPKPKKPDYESQTVNRREVEIEMKTIQNTEDESEPLIEEENEVPAFLRLNKPKESNIDEN